MSGVAFVCVCVSMLVTRELGHDLAYGAAPGECVSMGAVRRDQVICAVNSSLDSHRTCFLLQHRESVCVS